MGEIAVSDRKEERRLRRRGKQNLSLEGGGFARHEHITRTHQSLRAPRNQALLQLLCTLGDHTHSDKCHRR